MILFVNNGSTCFKNLRGLYSTYVGVKEQFALYQNKLAVGTVLESLFFRLHVCDLDSHQPKTLLGVCTET